MLDRFVLRFDGLNEKVNLRLNLIEQFVLHSKRNTNSDGVQDFQFPADKIEVMAGLRFRPEVTVEV